MDSTRRRTRVCTAVRAKAWCKKEEREASRNEKTSKPPPLSSERWTARGGTDQPRAHLNRSKARSTRFRSSFVGGSRAHSVPIPSLSTACSESSKHEHHGQEKRGEPPSADAKRVLGGKARRLDSTPTDQRRWVPAPVNSSGTRRTRIVFDEQRAIPLARKKSGGVPHKQRKGWLRLQP